MQNRVNTLIQSRVSLAPMAGITDYVLRSLVRKYSQNALLTTEMISSEFLAQVKGGDIIKREADHSPISYQISGHKPHLMRAAAEYLTPMADMIDINMGCPVNKVVKGQDGCSLMRNPALAADLVKAVKDGTNKPVSVKFRLGYTLDELNFVEFGQQMQKAGAEFITIHGRTRSQMYSGNADWKMIRKLKENVDIPVFANGDVTSIDSAIQCLEESGADGVAVGRASMGDPTLIGRIEHYFATGEKLPEPSIEEKIKILKTHLDGEIELRGEKVGIKFFRKFYPYYIAGIKNAAKIRSVLVTEEDYGKIISTLTALLQVC
ncbi:tRNA dihydrouridine synthase DusB [Spirochaetes bacterium]|uniref:tRNA-dihydrouridine synthase n=1 Tax=Candidatus Scatousia excrementipullorum TaxID=2840936 RepID=A0A9D9DS23_9BACT|nr:tRNA dihydrouridine synthase DusB [Candidatus Scatousia excrementipullorum]